MSSVNESGQAYGFLALTPVKPDEVDALRAYLEAMPRSVDSPLARSTRTHMARFVIITDFNNQPHYKQRKAEHLTVPWLAFSANADGGLDAYLDELCEVLGDEAADIWGHCFGCPDPPRGDALKTYLKHNQIDCGFFYSAYPNADVATVRRSLDQREKLMAFATRTQGMSPADLQQAFVAEFAS